MHMYNPTYVFQTHWTALHLATLLTIDYLMERVYIDLSGLKSKISSCRLKTTDGEGCDFLPASPETPRKIATSHRTNIEWLDFMI